MEDSKATILKPIKLVEDAPLVSYEIPVPAATSTKKRIRRIADPHIRHKTIKGRNYYYYCRGEDREIYLGTADSVLAAVMTAKGKVRNE